MARGGKRTGTPGKAYSNRTDLTPTAAPGQEYGQAKAQLDAQHAVPIPNAAAPVAAPPTQPGPAPGAMPAPMQPGATPFDAPSARPDEPVTAGLPIGAGYSPPPPPDPTQADVQTWRPYLGALEFMASQPGATTSTQNFVRRLRAMMPPASP